jgi:hypothetical protein
MTGAFEETGWPLALVAPRIHAGLPALPGRVAGQLAPPMTLPRRVAGQPVTPRRLDGQPATSTTSRGSSSFVPSIFFWRAALFLFGSGGNANTKKQTDAEQIESGFLSR